MNLFKGSLKIGAMSVLALSVIACFHGEDDEDTSVQATYKVSISNLTNGQPMTPVAVVLHTSGYNAWTLGATASSGLEKLAEGGDTTDFISEAAANMNVLSTNVAGSAPFGPGSVETVNLTATYNSGLKLSLAAMLANTNDAYTGLTSVDIGALTVGDSMTMMSHVFDAGTEADTESAGTFPGPANTVDMDDKGYSSTRNDAHDFITVHPGVITKDDGLSASVLTEAHRWNGVAAKIVIERI